MEKKFLFIVMIIIAFMACKTDSDSDPKCNCPIKEHLAIGENCSCGLANCDCSLIPICECPNGTLHLIGETWCERTDCVCEKNVAGVRTTVLGKATNEMPITNRENVTTEWDTIVVAVNAALNHVLFASTERQDYIKNNIKEIKIIQGDGLMAPTISNGVLTVEKACITNDIRGTLDTWLTELGMPFTP